MQTIIFATHNPNKLKEVQGIVGSDIKIISLQEVGLEEDIPEEEATLEGNALQKANYVYKKVQTPCFADDTGLEIDALNGEPGVYSARYAKEEAIKQNIPFDQANIRKVLAKLNNISNRKARFRTVIALIEREGDEKYFEGAIEGKIEENETGENGFGYDPIFIPSGYKKTFAELSLHEKNQISHRSIALKKLASYLTQ